LQPRMAQGTAQPAHGHPENHPSPARGSCCFNHGVAGTMPLQPWAPRWHCPSTLGLQTHLCQVTGIHHSRSLVSSRCSRRRGGHCLPGYSTSHTTSAPGLEAKRSKGLEGRGKGDSLAPGRQGSRLGFWQVHTPSKGNSMSGNRLAHSLK